MEKAFLPLSGFAAKSLSFGKNIGGGCSVMPHASGWNYLHFLPNRLKQLSMKSLQ